MASNEIPTPRTYGTFFLSVKMEDSVDSDNITEDHVFHDFDKTDCYLLLLRDREPERATRSLMLTPAHPRPKKTPLRVI